MGKLGLTATEIGRKINASAEVVNNLLIEKGLLTETRALTEAGLAFGVQRSATKNNSFDTFEWANWDESVIAVLDATPEKIAELTAALKEAKAAKRAAGTREAEEAFAAFLAEKAGKVVKDTGEGGLTNGQKVVIVVGVTAIVIVGGVLVYKGVKRHQRRKAERAAL